MTAHPVIAFQGELGAYSDLVARKLFPVGTTLPCVTFDEAFAAVESGTAQYGVIPIDNSIAGRVADIHRLLPHTNLRIIKEHFEPIHHQLLGIKGTTLATIKEARSHVHALAQCRLFLQEHSIRPVVAEDTAGGARLVAELQDEHVAAIASTLAAELYGLEVLAPDIESEHNNTTRFIVFSKEAVTPPVGEQVLTSIFFRLKSVPAALYKAIGGFATNNINLAKIESYMNGGFSNAEFYIEAEGHPDDERMQHALIDLQSFSETYRIMGIYPTHEYRRGRKP